MIPSQLLANRSKLLEHRIQGSLFLFTFIPYHYRFCQENYHVVPRVFQGYPLLGAKGNDMEDRNLGFKLFLVLGALVVLPASFTLIHSLTAPFVSWFGSFLTFPLVTRSGSERSERE